MNTNEENKPDWLQFVAHITICVALASVSWAIGKTCVQSIKAVDRIERLEQRLSAQSQLISNESSSIRAAVQNATRGQDMGSSDVLAIGYRSQHDHIGMSNNAAIGSNAATYKDNQITIRFLSGKSIFIDVPPGEIIDSGLTYPTILEMLKRAMEQRGETNATATKP